MTVDPGCPGRRHHTASAARNHGCTCPDARRANSLQNKAWRLRQQAGRQQPRTTPIVGTTRRLQALACIGWSGSQITRELGRAGQAGRVHQWRAGHTQRGGAHVLLETARDVAALYDRLSMTIGPCRRTRAIAARRGWVPPLAWDDDTIDDPDAQPNLTGPVRPAVHCPVCGRPSTPSRSSNCGAAGCQADARRAKWRRSKERLRARRREAAA